MDEFRRLLLFLVLSIALLFLWNSVRVRPGNRGQNADQPAANKPAEKPTDKPAEKPAAKPAEKATAKPVEKPAATTADKPDTKPEPAATVSLPGHPYEVVTIGSDDPRLGYGLQVQLTTRGAAVLVASSNDPRHLALPRPEVKIDPPLSIVGDHLRGLDSDDNGLSEKELANWKPSPLGVKELPLTLQTPIASLDSQLAAIEESASLNQVNWEVVDRSLDGEIVNGVTFRLKVGEINVTKTFRLRRLSDDELKQIGSGTDPGKLFDRRPAAYQLEFSLTLENLGSQATTLSYGLQGPVGVPLEDLENSRYASSIKWTKVNGSQVEVVDAITSADVAETEDEQERQQQPKETWHFVGIDVQYFAALLFPSPEQVEQSFDTTPRGYIAQATPQLVHRNSKTPLYTQVSVLLSSHDITLAAGKKVTHSYTLYAGPKRPQLLTPLKAQDVLDVTNIFWIGKHISRAMLYFLDVIHSLVPGLGYGFAIIVLTISVRLMMHPLTRKQALSAKIMKDLKPEIEKLKEKHGDDKQAFGRAQMELFRKHSYNPFSGCLPIIVQLPIFIGLYQAVGSSVDLRRAGFLYIDNLAGPDRLFHHGFDIPYLGSDFNLLPLITVVLYLVNNRMFMPPPTTDEAAMQQKMMNVMMIVFGFLFYRLPAGLLCYFIVSTLWGMGERKLMDQLPTPQPNAVVDGDEKPRKGIWGRVGRWMDEAQQKVEAQKQEYEQLQKQQKKGSGGKGGRKKKKRRR